MKLRELFNTIRLFVEKKIGGEELEAVFNTYHMKYFDYDKVNASQPKLAVALEELNEDIANFEPIEKLRLEHEKFFIDEEELRTRATKVLNLYNSIKGSLSDKS